MQVRDECILAGISTAQREQALAGRQFEFAMLHGKRLFLKQHDSLWLTLHLSLTGKLVYQESGAEEPNHTIGRQLEISLLPWTRPGQ